MATPNIYQTLKEMKSAKGCLACAAKNYEENQAIVESALYLAEQQMRLCKIYRNILQKCKKSTTNNRIIEIIG